jgi:site-specific recombinase XerD
MRKRLPGYFHGDEVERLLAATRCRRDRLLLELALGTGLRVSELAALRVQDLDVTRGTCFVARGKGDKQRTQPVPARLLPALRDWLAGHPGGWLWPSPRGKSGHLSVRAIQSLIVAAARRAGIARRVHAHMTRHHFATKLLQNGVNIRVVQELLAHEHLSSTELYTHVEAEHLRAAVDRL